MPEYIVNYPAPSDIREMAGLVQILTEAAGSLNVYNGLNCNISFPEPTRNFIVAISVNDETFSDRALREFLSIAGNPKVITQDYNNRLENILIEMGCLVTNRWYESLFERLILGGKYVVTQE